MEWPISWEDVKKAIEPSVIDISKYVTIEEYGESYTCTLTKEQFDELESTLTGRTSAMLSGIQTACSTLVHVVNYEQIPASITNISIPSQGVKGYRVISTRVPYGTNDDFSWNAFTFVLGLSKAPNANLYMMEVRLIHEHMPLPD